MIQIRIQQGLSQMPGLSGRSVFVEEQGFHHEFDETDQTAWQLVLYENGHAAGHAGSLHQTIRMCIYWAAWPHGNPAAADSTGSAWYGKRLVREAEGWYRMAVM